MITSDKNGKVLLACRERKAGAIHPARGHQIGITMLYLSDNDDNRGDGFAEILIVQSHPVKVPYPLFISLAYPTPVPNIWIGCRDCCWKNNFDFALAIRAEVSYNKINVWEYRRTENFAAEELAHYLSEMTKKPHG